VSDAEKTGQEEGSASPAQAATPAPDSPSAGNRAAPVPPATAQSSASPGAQPQTAAAAPPPAPARSGGGAIAWLALLLVLLLAGALAWSLIESQRREGQLLERIKGLETDSGQDNRSFEQLDALLTRKVEVELDGMQKTLQSELQQQARQISQLREDFSRDVQNRQDQLARQLAQLENSVAEQRAQLIEQRTQMSQLQVEDRDAWLLAEAQYLLRLANQRLIMIGDTEAAAALLRSVDAILRDMGDPRLVEVRRAVASDLNAVRSVPRLDLEGLYVRLQALIDRTDTLILFELPDMSVESTPVEGEDWQTRLKRGYEAAVDKLSEYVVVRRRDVPIEAMIDPQWEGLVRQNLRMLLEQGQVAMLSGNQALYEESLARARTWVQEFFATDEEAALAMSEELDALAAEKIAVEIPDVTRSLEALDTVMSRRAESP
jgi:uroporphyrin-3 C-methyltransferase